MEKLPLFTSWLSLQCESYSSKLLDKTQSLRYFTGLGGDMVTNDWYISLPRKKVVRLTELLDLTISVDWDVKPQTSKTKTSDFGIYFVVK